MSKRSDISDSHVIRACQQFHSSGPNAKAPWELLMEQTGCPEKIVYAAMERAESRDLIEFGVSLRTAWPTEKGLKLLLKEENI